MKNIFIKFLWSKIYGLFLFLILSIVLNSCAGWNFQNNQVNKESKMDAISLACWNTETFFNATKEGQEYYEFQKTEIWNYEKYSSRLTKLCNVMTSLNPDIFVLEEIENISVVYDLSNFLSQSISWSGKNKWNYACFEKNPESAIGCAVFSKYPIESLTCHNLDLRNQKNPQPSSRPILKLKINVNGKELCLFVNHWKSKSGGEEKTEIWRDWQESNLAYLVKKELELDSKTKILLCGDFNRDISEFVLEPKKETNTLLRCADFNEISFIKLFSPWVQEDGYILENTGSYVFNDQWNKIDHIFSNLEVQITNFAPQNQGPWADDQGKPISYNLYKNYGYSDHLPLMCTIVF